MAPPPIENEIFFHLFLLPLFLAVYKDFFLS